MHIKENPIYGMCSISAATYAITLNIATTTATAVTRATTRQLILLFDFKHTIYHISNLLQCVDLFI